MRSAINSAGAESPKIVLGGLSVLGVSKRASAAARSCGVRAASGGMATDIALVAANLAFMGWSRNCGITIDGTEDLIVRVVTPKPP